MGVTVSEFVNRVGFEVDQSSVTQVNNSISNLKSTAVRMLGAIGIGFSLKSLNSIAEEFNGINDRINAIVDAEEDQAEVQQNILESANNCKTSYESMAKSVEGLVNANADLFSIDEATEFTEYINKLGKASGYTDSEISTMGSSLQRIMSTGAASTSDITRMLRQTPALAKQLAEALGVSTQELSDMAAQGQLTAEVIKEAFLQSEDAIDQAYDQLDYSISDALLNIRNQWGYWVDDLNHSLKISESLAKMLVNGFTKVMSVLNKAKDTLVNLADKLGGAENLMKTLITFAGVFVVAMNWSRIINGAKSLLKVFGRIRISMLAMIAIAAMIALVINDFINFMKGNDSVIGYAFEQAGIDAQKMRDTVVDIWQNLKTFFKGLWDSIKAIFKPAIDWIKEKMKDIFGDDLFAGLGNGLAGVLEFFDRITSKLAENKGLQDTIGKIAVALLGIVGVSKVLGGLTRPISKFGGAISKVTGAFTGANKAGGATGGRGGLASGITRFFKSFATLKVTTVLKGLANLGIVLTGLTAMTSIIMAIAPSMAELTDGGSFAKTLLAITSVGVLGAALAAVCGLIGKLNVVTIAEGIAGIAVALGGFTAIAEAFGALSKIPGFNDLLNGGIEVLCTLAKGLGEFVGSIIGGIGEGVTNSLPAIGDNLSAFAENMEPFFSSISAADTSGISEFLGAIATFVLKMTASNILTFFSGKHDFVEIANQLSDFAKNLGGFFNAVNALPEEAFPKATALFESLEGMGKVMRTGGVAQLFTGTSDYGKIAEALQELTAPGVKEFYSMVASLPEDTFSKATSLFESLSGMGKVMQTGGLKQLITGSSDYGKAADALRELTTDGVREFYSMVAALPEDTFTKSTSLFESLSNMGKVMKTGGIAQLIAGSSDYSNITNSLRQLTTDGVRDFYSMVAALPSSTFENATALFQSLSDMGKVMRTGGIAQLLSGTSDYGEISASLVALAEGVRDFYDTAGTVDVSMMQGIVDGLQSFTDEILDTRNATTSDIEDIQDAFVNLGTNIQSSQGSIQTACATIKNTLTTAFDNVPNTFQNIGKNIMEGLTLGIQNGSSSVVSAITNSINQAVDAGKDAAGVHSPSTLMRDEIGEYLPEGVAVGIEENTDVVSNAMSTMMEGIIGSMGGLQTAFDGLNVMGSMGTVSPSTVSALGGNTTNNRSVSQNVNINNTFNGDRASQQKAASAMSQAADDTTAALARGLAYAR